MILGRGGGGLSVAFDMPTLMGRDSDDPKSLGEVGHCGVAIDSAADMERLFAGIDLGSVTTSMTISGPAVPVFCMMLVAAERAGVDTGVLNGTLQTDIFKEYIAQKEWLFGPEPHLRLIGDLMEYCAEQIPAYKPLSGLGYHIREAGSTAAQELAFTLADGFGYVELGLSRGLDVDVFAPGLSFFFDAHVDFFEEIAKFRAARRIWARWLRDVYGAQTEKAQWLRFHTQTAGVSLTAQQPYNNVVRTGIEALSAVLGGTNSLHTNALDETLALPSEQAAEIALRTQQVIMEETGVINVADPLGGSWYVEALTDQIEAEANAIFDRILAMGGSDLTHADTEGLAEATRVSTSSTDGIGPMTKGLLRGIEDGWFMSEIAEAAFQYQVGPGEGRQEDRGRQRPHRLGHPRPRDPAGLPRGRGRAGPRAGRTSYDARRRRRPRRGGGDGRGRPDRRQHDRGHAGGLPGGGHARRDLRRAACGVGRVPGAGALLRKCRRGSPERPALAPCQPPHRRLRQPCRPVAHPRPGRRGPGPLPPLGAERAAGHPGPRGGDARDLVRRPGDAQEPAAELRAVAPVHGADPLRDPAPSGRGRAPHDAARATARCRWGSRSTCCRLRSRRPGATVAW